MDYSKSKNNSVKLVSNHFSYNLNKLPIAFNITRSEKVNKSYTVNFAIIYCYRDIGLKCRRHSKDGMSIIAIENLEIFINK